MLRLMGYEASDWIELPNNKVLAETLVVPSYPVPNREELLWVRDRILGNIPQSVTVESPNRILLLRPDNIRRQLKNREAIEKLLGEYGFVSIAPEELSIAEQATYFSEAEIIVGAHGSALTNMIWSDNATVIELFNDRIEIGFYMLAAILNRDYRYVLCNTIEGRHLQVDLEDLESIITSAVDTE
jgi:capsular polysaccharide biosynthesis protein